MDSQRYVTRIKQREAAEMEEKATTGFQEEMEQEQVNPKLKSQPGYQEGQKAAGYDEDSSQRTYGRHTSSKRVNFE